MHRIRQDKDQKIITFVENLEPDFLETTISYVNNAGNRCDDPVTLLVPHLFNHQTHHHVLKPEPNEYR